MQTVGRYAVRTTTQRPFDDAIARVTELLAAQGFGIITEIDVQSTLRKKLGVESRPYRILGACNPGFAQRALEAEPHVGVFLPCNVVVWDEGGQRVVAAMEPGVMADVVPEPKLLAVANDVSVALRAALAGLD